MKGWVVTRMGKEGFSWLVKWSHCQIFLKDRKKLKKKVKVMARKKWKWWQWFWWWHLGAAFPGQASGRSDWQRYFSRSPAYISDQIIQFSQSYNIRTIRKIEIEFECLLQYHNAHHNQPVTNFDQKSKALWLRITEARWSQNGMQLSKMFGRDWATSTRFGLFSVLVLQIFALLTCSPTPVHPMLYLKWLSKVRLMIEKN